MDDTFAKDVLDGLTSPQKHLSSKYFYDDNGSRIFQEIMNMPTYYLTDSELEILSVKREEIVAASDFPGHFNIIEMGAGDGFKTFKLLEFLREENLDFTYIPIDISEEAMNILSQRLEEQLPGISVRPKVGDYFDILKEAFRSTSPSLLLFLGSNIGNYDQEKAQVLLKLFYDHMKRGDKLLIGMDLKKNPSVIRNAYNDPEGITKRFNLNLLNRINSEFDADFIIDDFDFYCHYNPITGEVRSYLVSLKPQSVHLKKLNKTIIFHRDELIWTELSKKYSIIDIERIAANSNFKIVTHFLDSKNYFADSLWEK